METSTLCIDLGNSRAKLALFQQNNLLNFRSFEYREHDLIQLFLKQNDFQGIAYCSVLSTSPDWFNQLIDQKKSLRIHAGIALPIDLSSYETPESLGSDRIAALAGAHHLQLKQPILVVNVGTCITFDLIDEKGRFIGGNISPGLDMRYQAMHQLTAKLPLVHAAQTTGFELGHSTHAAIENGGMEGVVFEIQGYFFKLLENYPQLKCVLTGGSAFKLVNRLNFETFADPYLVLKGLNYILHTHEQL